MKTNRGFWVFDDTHVLINPGNPADTLQACFDKNDEVIKKLNDLAVGATDVKPFDVDVDVTCHASLTADLLGSNCLTAGLLSAGFEVDVNQKWSLSIVGNVKKRAVTVTQLERIVNQARVEWFSENVIGVVTAVYVITGGLSYTGHIKAVIQGGKEMVTQTRDNTAVEGKAESEAQTTNTIEGGKKAQLEADQSNTSKETKTTNISVASTPGWQFTVIGNRDIVLTEREHVDWIVAIEYLEVKADKKDKKDKDEDEDGWLIKLKSIFEIMKAPF